MRGTWPVLLLLSGLRAVSHSLPPQYRLISTALPWLEAQSYCREHHTDLATIFDVDDVNRLVNAAQDAAGGFTQQAWIGLHDDLTSWRWSFSNGSSYAGEDGDYRNWDLLQPDNFLGNQTCVTMGSRGAWEDSVCFLRNSFICYNGSNGSSERFVFVQQGLSWPDAQLYCRMHHTDLVSIRDEKENQEIQSLANGSSVWIGLYRIPDWSDGSNSTYRNWKTGQPDNAGGTENCTATDLGGAGLWSDERCERRLAFVCYGENGKTITTKAETTEASPVVRRTAVPEHVIHLRVKLTSKVQLSEGDIMLSDEFQNLLMKLGLPANIMVGLRRPLTVTEV